jgi:hypothetical protein
MTTPPTTIASPLIRDSRLLLYLFISFRLMLLLVHQPQPGYTPGMTAFGDFSYFYDLAKFADQGKLPYRDYWFEYPLVLAFVSQGVYTVAHVRGGDFTAYILLMNVVLLAFDTGNLLLIKRIGTQLRGPAVGMALAWIYALMAVPVIFSFWNFDAIVAFFTLLATAWLLRKRDMRSAVAAGVGALTKFMPLLVLGAVWRYRSIREALRYSVIALGITIVGLAAMVLFGGSYGISSLAVQFNKASSETVWALLDGNYKTGILNPDHLDPQTALQVQGNPATIPTWLRTAIFGAIGLYIYATTRRHDERGLMAFVGISFALFYLWLPNWSPQWQITLIPLILLNMPSRNGVLLILGLAFVNFIEFPVLFSRTNGEISGPLLPIFVILILLRTAILIGFAVVLYKQLRISAGNIDDNSQQSVEFS